MRRRALRKLIGGVGIGFLSLLAFVADLTGNLGLWTLGGTVGMARATYLCLGYLAYDLLCDGLDSLNGGVFREVHD